MYKTIFNKTETKEIEDKSSSKNKVLFWRKEVSTKH